MTTRSDQGHSEEMMDLLRSYDLCAADTYFKSATWGASKKRRVCNVTYLVKEENRRSRKLDYICVSNK